MNSSSMSSTVAALLASHKGILAADESAGTIEKRFAAVGLPSTEANRQAYREMLFTTPGLSQFISGVILFDETFRQRTEQGFTMPELIAKSGMLPGIKVDKGTAGLANLPGETMTQGLDLLRERLAEYAGLGARFTKWRAVFAVGENLPTRACVAANATALALFAGLSQEAGLVPIVEPEVLMDGRHTIERCEEVMTETLRRVFAALLDHRIVLENMILKTGMVLAGSECAEQSGLEAVAEATLRCLRRTVSAAVPGIVFLSGGQGEAAATQRLNAICQGGDAPWTFTFSFGRALQESTLEVWRGARENIGRAQAALYERARANHLAARGTYPAGVIDQGAA